MAAIAAGLTPLALEQPASAYDSVVAMLQSHLEVCQRTADANGGDLHGYNHSDNLNKVVSTCNVGRIWNLNAPQMVEFTD